jgi:phage terminase large subunit-like protein
LAETSELAATGHVQPRLETTTKSGALSHAAVIGDFSEKVLGVTLQPWQLRILHGMTELNPAGNFVNRVGLCSVARQAGKTTAMAALVGSWLATQGFGRGKPQTIITCSHQLDLSTALFKYLAPILGAKFNAKISWSYGRMNLEMPDGSTWLVRAATPQAGHGYSADLICVDEVWSVSEAAIDEGLLPSQRARKNPLMAMFSTAGTPESKALLRWREQGIRAIDSGQHGPLYFAEYSPPSNIDPMTPEAWVYANPALGYTLDMSVIEAEAKAPNRNAFLRGSVNLWTSSHSGWLENGLWEACLYTGEVPAGGVLAIEQSIDEARYVGVRAVRVDNKTVITTAFDVDNMAEMWACVEREVERAPQLRIAITPVLETHCPPKHERRRTIVGYRELLKWTLAVRSLIIENRIGQTGEKLLAEHVERAVMIKHQGSVALSSTRSPGPIELARCMVWAAALESRPSSAGKPLLVISG